MAPISEFPMYPKKASAFIGAAFEENCAEAAEAAAIFFNEVAAAQQKFITALKKILPEWDEQKSS